MYICPGCGAGMRYDIAGDQMLCDYCGYSCGPYDHSEGKEAKEDNTFDVTVFTCPQCGGEIMTTGNEAAGFCSYCGASVVFESRMDAEQRPRFIIPFRKTKEDCKKEYLAYVKKRIFTPKEFRDPEYLERMRGIYLPYWDYHVTQKGRTTLDGTRESGNYTEHLKVTVDLDADYRGMYYDASSSFDDEIAQKIASFDHEGQREFSPAYLSGFYADMADVDSETYKWDAMSAANKKTLEGLSDLSPDYSDVTFKVPGKPFSRLHTKLEDTYRLLLPVWFLTWRKGDRVSYAVMNGQTGRLTADLPVDIRRYLGFSVLLAVPVFLLLLRLPVPTAFSALAFCVILSLLTAGIYYVTLWQMSSKEQRKADKGYQKIREKMEKLPVTKEASVTWTDWILPLVPVPAGALILLIRPVSDLYYYGGMLFVLLTVCVVLIRLIRRYNILATRPIPQFHQREGGDDRA